MTVLEVRAIAFGQRPPSIPAGHLKYAETARGVGPRCAGNAPEIAAGANPHWGSA
jgi:hypothetical protein